MANGYSSGSLKIDIQNLRNVRAALTESLTNNTGIANNKLGTVSDGVLVYDGTKNNNLGWETEFFLAKRE